MIKMDDLERIDLGRIATELNRKKWDLPFDYDLEYLGGFYETPAYSFGVQLHFGSKTGDKHPVTLDLISTKGVLLPGAKYYTYEFNKKAAERANKLCKQLGLPPLLGEPAVDPLETWQKVFPNDKCQMFKGSRGFRVVVGGEDTLLKITITDIPPLKGPRYSDATLYDLDRVAKNCPKAERQDMLGYLKVPGELLRGKSLIDAADFKIDPSGSCWNWNHKIEGKFGGFRLKLEMSDETRGVPDTEMFDRALDLVFYTEKNYDYIHDLIFADYRRCAQSEPEKLVDNGVPLELSRKEVAAYVHDCALVVSRDSHSLKKSYKSTLLIPVKWEKEPGLEFTHENGEVVALREKPFEIREGVLWYRGDKVAKKTVVPNSASPEILMARKLLQLAPLRINSCETPTELTAKTKRLFAAAQKAGFTHLGWLEVVMMMPMQVAAFSNEDGTIELGILFTFGADEMDPTAVDLVSHLNDNRKLSTTTSETAISQPERGIFKHSYPKASIADLLALHTEQLNKLKGDVVLRVHNLETFEKSVREYIHYELQL